MGRNNNGRKSAERDGAGRFAKGNPGGPGRPPGSPNRRTFAGKALLKALEAGDEGAGLPGGFDRMKRLLLDEDPRVRLGAERLVLGLLHGRPAAPDVDEEGNGPGRLDPATVALRLANFVARAIAEGPEADEEAAADATGEDDPPPAA